MAEDPRTQAVASFLRLLEEACRCRICLSPTVNATRLRCGDSFCSSCLKDQITAAKSKTASCPLCSLPGITRRTIKGHKSTDDFVRGFKRVKNALVDAAVHFVDLENVSGAKSHAREAPPTPESTKSIPNKRRRHTGVGASTSPNVKASGGRKSEIRKERILSIADFKAHNGQEKANFNNYAASTFNSQGNKGNSKKITNKKVERRGRGKRRFTFDEIDTPMPPMEEGEGVENAQSMPDGKEDLVFDSARSTVEKVAAQTPKMNSMNRRGNSREAQVVLTSPASKRIRKSPVNAERTIYPEKRGATRDKAKKFQFSVGGSLRPKGGVKPLVEVGNIRKVPFVQLGVLAPKNLTYFERIVQSAPTFQEILEKRRKTLKYLEESGEQGQGNGEGSSDKIRKRCRADEEATTLISVTENCPPPETEAKRFRFKSASNLSLQASKRGLDRWEKDDEIDPEPEKNPGSDSILRSPGKNRPELMQESEDEISTQEIQDQLERLQEKIKKNDLMTQNFEDKPKQSLSVADDSDDDLFAATPEQTPKRTPIRSTSSRVKRPLGYPAADAT